MRPHLWCFLVLYNPVHLLILGGLLLPPRSISWVYLESFIHNQTTRQGKQTGTWRKHHADPLPPTHPSGVLHWYGQSMLTTLELLMGSSSQTPGDKLALQINYANHPHWSRMVCFLGIFLCFMRPIKDIKQVLYDLHLPSSMLVHHLHCLPLPAAPAPSPHQKITLLTVYCIPDPHLLCNCVHFLVDEESYETEGNSSGTRIP